MNYVTVTVDLHPVFRNSRDIDIVLRQKLFEALRVGADTLEIIPGKGSGQLKNRVLAFLGQKHIRKLYARIELDPTNAGRVLVHFSAR